MDRLQSLVEPWEDQIDKVREQAVMVAEQAKEGLVRGREAMVSLEEAVVRRVQQNPRFYIMAGLALVGLLLAKRFFDRRYEGSHYIGGSATR